MGGGRTNDWREFRSIRERGNLGRSVLKRERRVLLFEAKRDPPPAGGRVQLPDRRIFQLQSELALTDWIEWSGDWSSDCKGQKLLLKDVSHRKSSGAEQLFSVREIRGIELFRRLVLVTAIVNNSDSARRGRERS
ncbi:hypothetical protein SRHO_G00200620 [Serrasalmus rhombeus]